jgi:hypothetical protein
VLAESKDLLTVAIEVHQLVTIVQLLCLLQLIIRLLQLIRVEQAFPLGGRPGFPLFHSSLTFVPSKNKSTISTVSTVREGANAHVY